MGSLEHISRVHSESNDYVNCLYFVKGSVYFHYNQALCNNWNLLLLFFNFACNICNPQSLVAFHRYPLITVFVFCLVK